MPGVWKEQAGKLTPEPACTESGVGEVPSTSVGQVGRASRSRVLAIFLPCALLSSALSGMEPLFPVASEEQSTMGKGRGDPIVWEDQGGR